MTVLCVLCVLSGCCGWRAPRLFSSFSGCSPACPGSRSYHPFSFSTWVLEDGSPSMCFQRPYIAICSKFICYNIHFTIIWIYFYTFSVKTLKCTQVKVWKFCSDKKSQINKNYLVLAFHTSSRFQLCTFWTLSQPTIWMFLNRIEFQTLEVCQSSLSVKRNLTNCNIFLLWEFFFFFKSS